MKPVIPEKNQNPFQGMFRQLRSTDPEDLKGAVSILQFVFKGMKR